MGMEKIYLTQSLSTKEYGSYKKFRSLLYDKKYNIGYTYLIIKLLTKFCQSYLYLKNLYTIKMYYNYTYTNTFLNKSVYTYSLNKCKYIDSHFYKNLKYNKMSNNNKFLIVYNFFKKYEFNTTDTHIKLDSYFSGYKHTFYKHAFYRYAPHNQLLLYYFMLTYYKVFSLI